MPNEENRKEATELPKKVDMVKEVEGKIAKEMTKDARPSARIMKFFDFSHLPAPLREVSEPVFNLAQWMFENLPEGPEKTTGLRKLLEAKDAFVRARLDGSL